LKWTTKDRDETVRGRTRENEGAKLMAEEGYDIEQTPPFSGQKKPDFRIEGKIFDHFAPSESKNLRGVFGAVQKKVATGQTRRLIINLTDSPLTADQLRAQFAEWPIPGLEEVIAIKNREIHHVFP
jgi:Contact-dependent growth inhibition CdiA C-terminal domain